MFFFLICVEIQVKPKPALTRLEVQHQAVEQILAQQRAISPIREHIERRNRAEVCHGLTIHQICMLCIFEM
jgi:hypothetical protein